MFRKEVLFASTIILIGALDWLTTLIGILLFGATEINPLLASLTTTNMLLFSVIKLSAITVTGFAFYKAGTKTEIIGQISTSTKRFLHFGYVICLFCLLIVVLNNVSAIVNLSMLA